MILGDHTFRRVVSLAILSELNADQPPEIMHMALVRARFCEMTARMCGLEPAEQYLLGMFSLVPAMLKAPMSDLIRSLPLRAQICEALQGTTNRERSLLTWLEFHENGNWIASDAVAESIGLGDKKLNLFYAEAVIWAQVALSSAVSRK
jgi:EAL and modified HD-GYP domain-containing signal transduction protein